MCGLSTDEVCFACRIFLDLAYPGGEESIPPNPRKFLTLPAGQSFAEYYEQTSFSPTWLEVLKKKGEFHGYALRLGSAHYPNLKLNVQWVADHGQQLWVFSVDTHDAFLVGNAHPPVNHPDAQAWMEMQQKNARLKEQIEQTWEKEGLLTFNGLLRIELKNPAENNE